MGSTTITIGMALMMLTIWLGRIKVILQSLKKWHKNKRVEDLKPILTVIKLFLFDIIVTLGTVIIVGSPNSTFAITFIISVNAITTIFGELFFRLSDWYAENLTKNSMKQAEVI